jgi:hypothetical protein
MLWITSIMFAIEDTIKYCWNLFWENTQIQVIGCRHPTSLIGNRDNAYIVGIQDDSLTACFFVDGRDFIAHPSILQAFIIYETKINEGWIKMDLEDIIKTGGFMDNVIMAI